MLSNPLTPPNDYSTDVGSSDIYADNGINLTAQDSSDDATQHFATPISNISMGFEDEDGRIDMEDRSESYDVGDEDQDMSDRGAPLMMTLSHAEQLNAELDLLDAEVMGHDNLVELFYEDHYPPAFESDQYTDGSPSPEHYSEHLPNQPDSAPGDVYMHGIVDASNLPTAMSEVSLQLQHIQDGQEHAESAEVADELHAAFINNSTPSILLNLFSSSAFNFIPPENTSLANFVSLAEVSSMNNISVTAGSQTAPHLWSTEGWTPNPTLDVVVALQNQHPAAVPITDLALDDASETDQNEVEDQFNLSLGDFLFNWGSSLSHREDSKKRHKCPSLTALHKQRLDKLTPMHRSDLQGEICDIQRINWANLGVSRFEARQLRRSSYKNYTNLRLSLPWHPRLIGARLADDQNFYRFRKMDFDHDIHLSHFQLRNLMACASRDHVFYAGRAKVLQWNPTRSSGREKLTPSVAMDLTDPIVQPPHAFAGGIQISTLTVAHDILVAGGFCGEYGLVNLKAPKKTKHTEGLITDHLNSITNHVQVHLSRSSAHPLAAFASNDHGMRLLDINTNTFVAEHKYEHAVNCSAISPDQRLRVLVGDTRSVMICNAETGEILHNLKGHRDFGFACDWADNGWTVATGNQDMQVKIWDARKWTDSSGQGRPVATIAAEMAGVRKLKFSPLGSGKRVLIAAEPADFISVIDAETFTSKQTLSFFGEIGGVDFTNDGQDLFVANCDNMRGGLMEFERCDFGSESLYSVKEYAREDGQRRTHWEIEGEREGVKNHRYRSTKKAQGYDWMATDEELIYHPKSRGTLEQRRRRAARLGDTMGHF